MSNTDTFGVYLPQYFNGSGTNIWFTLSNPGYNNNCWVSGDWAYVNAQNRNIGYDVWVNCYSAGGSCSAYFHVEEHYTPPQVCGDINGFYYARLMNNEFVGYGHVSMNVQYGQGTCNNEDGSGDHYLYYTSYDSWYCPDYGVTMRWDHGNILWQSNGGDPYGYWQR